VNRLDRYLAFAVSSDPPMLDENNSQILRILIGNYILNNTSFLFLQKMTFMIGTIHRCDFVDRRTTRAIHSTHSCPQL